MFAFFADEGSSYFLALLEIGAATDTARILVAAWLAYFERCSFLWLEGEIVADHLHECSFSDVTVGEAFFMAGNIEIVWELRSAELKEALASIRGHAHFLGDGVGIDTCAPFAVMVPAVLDLALEKVESDFLCRVKVGIAEECIEVLSFLFDAFLRSLVEGIGNHPLIWVRSKNALNVKFEEFFDLDNLLLQQRYSGV
ncbi:MAG: hypothetical protein ACRDHW_15525 [Ktedonobacteraceae bacterium]